MGAPLRKADELVQRFLDSIGQSGGSEYVELFRSWQGVIGEHLAAHSRPVDVRGRHLVIEADHPGWVQLVMLARGRILRELGRRFPDLGLTGIMVRNAAATPADGPGSATPSGASAAAPPAGRGETPGLRAKPAADPQPEAPPRPPSRDDLEALERIPDDDLRAALARLRGELPEEP